MKFDKLVEYLLLGAISCAVYFLGGIMDSLKSLNEKVAVIIERQLTQGEELKGHENRIRSLEFKKSR